MRRCRRLAASSAHSWNQPVSVHKKTPPSGRTQWSRALARGQPKPPRNFERAWLATLPPRLALDQEDAIRFAAEQCGYSPEATRRAFAARYVAPDRHRSRPMNLTPDV
jgi:hypothetical protein